MTECLNDEMDSQQLPETDIRAYGNSTGLGLKKQNPEKHQTIVRAFEAGCSIRETAQIFGIAKNTAGAICMRELGQEGVRKATIQNLQRLVHESSGDLVESLDELSPMQKATVMGISADKLNQMADTKPDLNAMQITQFQVTANISDDAVTKLIQAAMEKEKIIEV
jgi:hypothetical protein